MIVTISEYNADEIMLAAYRLSKLRLVAHAFTGSSAEHIERRERLGVEVASTAHGWICDLYALMKLVEQRGAYKLLVIDAFDDIKTPRKEWGNIIKHAAANGLTIWCCAKSRKLLGTMRCDARSLTIAEAERVTFAGWYDTAPAPVPVAVSS